MSEDHPGSNFRFLNPATGLICASANPDKVREIEQLLAGRVVLIPRPAGIPDVEETEDTLVGNARLKARAIAQSPLNVARVPAVADDTGLFVDALPGELGVRTARYAEGDPEHLRNPYAANRHKLLRALDDRGCLDAAQRTAHFLTVVVVLTPDGDELVVEGRCDGVIALRDIGERGFGFDPVFVPTPGMFDGDTRTFAQMTDQEKNELSHRGRAFRALGRALESSPPA